MKVRPTQDGAVTMLLRAAEQGDEAAFQEVYARLYDELRLLARHVRRRQSAATLNTTALVHEAYIKLVPGQGLAVRDRAHFLRIAARAMRQVLVDAARRRLTRERKRPRLQAEGAASAAVFSADVLSLDDALRSLEAASPRQARVVECRFFAGLSVEETAVALDVSAPTVKRDWRVARAWLAHALTDGLPPEAAR